MKILHIIDSLDYGGAERLLISYIPLLTEHKHIIVTLNGPNVFDQDNYEYIQLNNKVPATFFKTVRTFRKIIKKNRVEIVHSHSYWTNIIARIATPSNVKLFNHYHFADYETKKDERMVRMMIIIDKILKHKSLTRLAVSQFLSCVLIRTFPKGNIKVIPNFISCIPSEKRRIDNNTRVLKVIAIGTCKSEKNYKIILEAFNKLKDEPIEIDIIGGGPYLNFFRSEVKRLGLSKVNFLGPASDVRERLASYDLFLSASISESFGIAVLESVCAHLPLLLSEIPAFKEIAPNGACFFNPFDKEDLIHKLKSFVGRNGNIDYADYERTIQKYSSQSYLSILRNLYNN
jgi:glycosyltransferase involved in cell wall biosynthesis